MSPVLQSALAEVRDNPRLRLGLIAVLAIVWLYALLWWRDVQVDQRDQLAGMHEQADRLRPFERAEATWQARLVDARQLTAGMQTYLWEARSRSLAEAAFRDWLQSRAQSAGLAVRELTVRIQDGEPTAVQTPDAAAGSGPPFSVRARLVASFAPAAGVSLLLAVHSNKQHVGVQRMQFRNAPPGQESTFDLELVAPFAIREARP